MNAITELRAYLSDVKRELVRRSNAARDPRWLPPYSYGQGTRAARAEALKEGAMLVERIDIIAAALEAMSGEPQPALDVRPPEASCTPLPYCEMCESGEVHAHLDRYEPYDGPNGEPLYRESEVGKRRRELHEHVATQGDDLTDPIRLYMKLAKPAQHIVLDMPAGASEASIEHAPTCSALTSRQPCDCGAQVVFR